MARILVLNNYDLAGTRKGVVSGRAHDHYLYGLNYFEQAGHAVEVVPFQRSRNLRRASAALRRLPVPLGDLDQQGSALRAARRSDLIYCPSQNIGQLLAYLRWARMLDRPIVWVVHHPLDTGRLRRVRRPVMRALLGGLDAYPALSAPVARDLAAIAGTDERTGVAGLGPDPRWYPRSDETGSGVIATGRTQRDFETFVRGGEQAQVRTWIVSSGMTQHELMEQYARARAVAIPLRVRWPWPMNGLNSLMDALGMGKAVILTRNPWLDLDVEALGIGIWVAPGDVAGWRDALAFIDGHPDEAREMGRRARALVDAGRSSETFARKLMNVFERVLAR